MAKAKFSEVQLEQIKSIQERIVALRTITCGQPDHEGSVGVVYCDFLFGLLCPQNLDEE